MERTPIIVYQFGRVLYSLPPGRPLTEIASPSARENMRVWLRIINVRFLIRFLFFLIVKETVKIKNIVQKVFARLFQKATPASARGAVYSEQALAPRPKRRAGRHTGRFGHRKRKEVEGQSPRRVPQDAKFLQQQSAGGAKNIPAECFSVGNPRRGFPDTTLRVVSMVFGGISYLLSYICSIG